MSEPVIEIPTASNIQEKLTAEACDVSKEGYAFLRRYANLVSDIDKLNKKNKFLDKLNAVKFTPSGRLGQLDAEVAQANLVLLMKGLEQIGGILEANNGEISTAIAELAQYGS